jgi:gluconolactonase
VNDKIKITEYCRVAGNCRQIDADMKNILLLTCFHCLMAPAQINAQLPVRRPAATTQSQTLTPDPDGDSLVTPSLAPRLIARQFGFTEGAAVDKEGNVFFTDQPNNKIWEYDIEGRLSLFLDSAGRSNGMYFDGKGNLVTCADEYDQLWSISTRKKIRVLLKNVRGRRLNGPNDLWISPGGGIYFTDPYYQRSYWDRSHPDIEGEKVYYLPKGKTTAAAVTGNLEKPNGIVGTPDGNYLYVALLGSKIYKYQIGPEGQLSDPRLFAEQGSDGMTLDEKGNLYLTGDGITVYNSAGKKIAHIPIPEKWTGNLCFGGKNRTDLFITASEGIYILPMRVKGVE